MRYLIALLLIGCGGAADPTATDSVIPTPVLLPAIQSDGGAVDTVADMASVADMSHAPVVASDMSQLASYDMTTSADLAPMCSTIGQQCSGSADCCHAGDMSPTGAGNVCMGGSVHLCCDYEIVACPGQPGWCRARYDCGGGNVTMTDCSGPDACQVAGFTG